MPPPFFVYFNELSVPSANDVTKLHDSVWEEIASRLISCLRAVSVTHAKLSVRILKGTWNSEGPGDPLSIKLKKSLNDTQYLWLLSNLQYVSHEKLNVDVYVNGSSYHGVTMSNVADSWICSLPLPESSWLSPEIAGTLCALDGDLIAERLCAIRNLALEDHAVHWNAALSDWGREIANNNVIGQCGNFPLTMYPLDHNPPHIHLVDTNPGGRGDNTVTLAKYRIDQFVRMEGKPTWDHEMREWIENNQTSLIESWQRCRVGGHPCKI